MVIIDLRLYPTKCIQSKHCVLKPIDVQAYVVLLNFALLRFINVAYVLQIEGKLPTSKAYDSLDGGGLESHLQYLQGVPVLLFSVTYATYVIYR